MKWRPTCHKIAPDKLENGAQCCFNKFDYRLFISKFSQFAFYLSLYSQSLQKSSTTLMQVLQPFIVAWCHSVKLYALSARPFQSQQSGALTRM